MDKRKYRLMFFIMIHMVSKQSYAEKLKILDSIYIIDLYVGSYLQMRK